MGDARGRKNNKNMSESWGRERESGAESEDEFEADFQGYTGVTAHKQTARNMFGLDQLRTPKVPSKNLRKKKMKILGKKKKNGKKKNTFEQVSPRKDLRKSKEDVGNISDFSDDDYTTQKQGKKKLKPKTLRKKDSSKSRGRGRSNSHAWASQASKMRRSIRSKSGVFESKHVEDTTAEGLKIVRQIKSNRPKSSKRKAQQLYQNQLKTQVEGIAGKLTGEALLTAKLMGIKSYWRLSRVIRTTNPSNATNFAEEQNMKISRAFLLYTAAEVCDRLARIHSNSNSHGSLASEKVLFNRNMEIYLQKRGTVAMKDSFRVSSMQKDMVRLGVVLIELLCLKRVGLGFCPNASKALDLVSSLGATKARRKSVRMVRFADIEPDIQQEVEVALQECSAAKGADKCIEWVVKCFSAKPGSRPIASVMSKAFLSFAKSLLAEDQQNEVISEEELLETLKTIISHPKLKSSFLRGPKVFDIAQKAEPKKRKDGIKSSAPEGYVTDESHFVSDADIADVEDIGTETEVEDVEAESKATNAATVRSDLGGFNFKAEEKKKKKGGFSKLRAFLGAQKELEKAEMDALVEADDSKSNVETKAKAKKTGLAAYSVLDDYRESQSVDENDLTRDVSAEVRDAFGIDENNLKAFKRDIAAQNLAKQKRMRFDPEKLAQKFELQQRISEEACMSILEEVREVMAIEPNMLDLKAPVTVVGDIHGQFFDLRTLFKQAGNLKSDPTQQYLFLGDYVDRGNFSCEVLFYLYALKIKFPTRVWLLRGNHESRATCSHFGFKAECEKKYGMRVFFKCCEAFKAMPIAATIKTKRGKFFCLHGGISSEVRRLHQFTEFDRFTEPQMYGFLCDVLWADPVSLEDEDVNDDDEDLLDEGGSDDGEVKEVKPKLDKKTERSLGEFYPNPLRQCSCRFGLKALMRFLKENKLVGIIRAHQVQQEGFRFHFQELSYSYYRSELGYGPDTWEEVSPPVVTVFSAPNYAQKYGNKAAYLNVAFDIRSFALEEPETHHMGRLVKRTSAAKPRRSLHSSKKGKVQNPIALLDPVQFEAVDEPPVVKFNESKNTSLSIERVCPYMPTGFDALIDRALSLQGDVVDVLAENAKETWERAKNNPDWKDDDLAARRQSKMSGKFITEKKPAERKSLSVAEESKQGYEDDEVPGNWTSFENHLNSTKEVSQRKYRDARKGDRLNMMNPLKLQETTEKAAKLMKETKSDEFNLPEVITLLNENNEEDKKNSKATRGRRKRNRASFALNELQKQKTVSFSESELIALRTLFLLINFGEDGKISSQDLIKWTEGNGGYIPDGDADLVISIIDFDKDGFIGFEDYLVFAAASKKIWLAEQMAKIITEGLST